MYYDCTHSLSTVAATWTSKEATLAEYPEGIWKWLGIPRWLLLRVSYRYQSSARVDSACLASENFFEMEEMDRERKRPRKVEVLETIDVFEFV